ncbi:MAG: glycosyltransferase [Flavobacteriales bacterium]|nr:glycosyltransferase [Flavobacteriales bacterium]
MNSMGSPMVSVCIPVYKRYKNIGKIRASIRSQLTQLGLEKWELILVDDSGGDESCWNQLLSYKKNFSEIRLIRLKKNFGQTVAVQIGLFYSNGEFIVTLDDDVLDEPALLPRLFNKMSASNCDIVYGVRATVSHNIRATFLGLLMRLLCNGEYKPDRTGSSIRLIKATVLSRIDLRLFDSVFFDIKFYHLNLKYEYVALVGGDFRFLKPSGYSVLDKIKILVLLIHVNGSVSQLSVTLFFAMFWFSLLLVLFQIFPLTGSNSLWLPVLLSCAATIAYFLFYRRLVMDFKKDLPVTVKDGVSTIL